jgi:peptidoglycan hydrolase CwlO-like protein
MINWIKSLTTRKEIKILQKQVEDLKNDITSKQEVINKTNAYWKKKLYNLEAKMKKASNRHHEM